MKGPVVFDFDKTLTEKDTLVGFYYEVSNSKLRYYTKLPFLWIAAVLYKVGIISNDLLKKVGVWLFLNGISRDKIDKAGHNYSSRIKLNDIYRNEFLNYTPKEVLIISASFEDYLKPIFTNYTVVGSKLRYNSESKVNGVLTNMYGERKKEWLLNKKIDHVEEFYTDSLADQPVIDLSGKVFLVKDNEKRQMS